MKKKIINTILALVLLVSLAYGSSDGFETTTGVISGFIGFLGMSASTLALVKINTDWL